MSLAPSQTGSPVPLPPVDDPSAWVQEVLAPLLGLRAPVGPDPDWLRLDGLDRDLLAGLHARLVGDGATGAAAAKWLASWLAGGPAAAVGGALALAGAALVPDPAAVRWHLHQAGWPDGLDLGAPRVVVTAEHPWAGRPGVDVVDDAAQVRLVARDGVVALAGPLVERLRRLGRAGLPSLWAEVGDRLGLAVRDPALPVHARAVEELRAVVALPGAPWRVRPVLGVGPTAAGPAYLGQKGGCCLAFQCTADDGADDPTGWTALYRARFPDRQRYCLTCPLLDAADAAARQRLHVEHVRA